MKSIITSSEVITNFNNLQKYLTTFIDTYNLEHYKPKLINVLNKINEWYSCFTKDKNIRLIKQKELIEIIDYLKSLPKVYSRYNETLNKCIKYLELIKLYRNRPIDREFIEEEYPLIGYKTALERLIISSNIYASEYEGKEDYLRFDYVYRYANILLKERLTIEELCGFIGMTRKLSKKYTIDLFENCINIIEDYNENKIF